MPLNFDLNNKVVQKIVEAAPLQDRALQKKEKRDVRVSFTVKQSELEMMNQFCDASGINRSNLIRQAVIEYVKKHQM